MEYNVFYLLGAGASVDNFRFGKFKTNKSKSEIGLPLAHNFSECINKNILQHLFSDEGTDIIKKMSLTKIFDIPKKIVYDKTDLLPYHSLTNLDFGISDYNTIDEAIRTYYFNNHHDDVFEFKIAMSILFYTLENALYYRDYRYKQFFLTTLKNDKRLPNNLFFLSWNYDNQMEHSLNELLTNNTFGILSNLNYLRINGRADFYPLPAQKVNSIARMNSRLITSGLHDYHKKNIETIHKSKTSNISFAWENEPNKDIKKELGMMLSSSPDKKNVLVCIGYSFPFINELFDKEIINTLKPDKIYFQNTNNDIQYINQIKDMLTKNYLDNSKQVQFEFIGDVSRFYIPNELTKYETIGNYDIR